MMRHQFLQSPMNKSEALAALLARYHNCMLNACLSVPPKSSFCVTHIDVDVSFLKLAILLVSIDE